MDRKACLRLFGLKKAEGLGLYRDNGKENGKYNSIAGFGAHGLCSGLCWGSIGLREFRVPKARGRVPI